MSDTNQIKSGTKHKSEKERRSQILSSSMTIFLDKGYHKTTMKEIMTATSLSKGAIYHYFASKEEIFLAIIHDFNSKLKDDFTALPDSDTPLRDIKQNIIENLEEMIRFYRLSIVCHEMTDSEEVQTSLDEITQYLRSSLVDAIVKNYQLDSGLEPEDVAFSFNMMMEGLLATAATQHSFDARKELPKLLKVVDYLMNTPSIQRKDGIEESLL